MQAQKLVTKIDANPLLVKHNNENSILRVCAYCRVSTDSDDQVESYRAQVEYYTQAIAKNPKWRFVDIYADEGITGTSVRKRDRFNKMMKDCEKGKIDLILTKSVSRFARNTVDSLKYVRKLKAKGIGVFFEEQNLDSLKADSEMFIGLHSVLAQAESESISANVKWGIRQRMRSGTFAFRYNILGYVKGDDGQPCIEPNGAKVIQTIFEKYLSGNSLDQIKAYLESNNILTATGKREWSKAIIKNILMNERYTGDMLLQKTFTENCITKKVKKNRGEMAKYLITNNHPAIIDRLSFKKVQIELTRRSNKRKVADKTLTSQGKYSGKYALSDLLVCGECGSPYRRRTWSRNGEKKNVWRCLSRVEHGTKFCKDSISIEEGKLHKLICGMLAESLKNDKKVLEVMLANTAYLKSGDDDNLTAYAINSQIEAITEQIKETVKVQSSSSGDPQNFEESIQEFARQLSVLRQEQETLNMKLTDREESDIEIENLKQLLEQAELDINIYQDEYIRKIIDYIQVMSDGRINILLKAGIKIEGKLD